jgi:hypothetical protein
MAMLGLWGSVGRRRAWRRGSCVLGAVVLALGAGCSADPAEPTTVVLKDIEGARFAAVSADGVVYVADRGSLYAIPPKPEPNATVSSSLPVAIGATEDTPYVVGLTRDLRGTVWMTAEQTGQYDGTTTAAVSGRSAGLVHRADSSVDRLTALRKAAVPALPPHRAGRPISAVAVQDADSMLVSTSQGGLSDNGDDCDVIVWRVDARGAVAAAGRVTPIRAQKSSTGPRYLGLLRRPAQSLTEGESAPATSVDLQQVEVMLPLDRQRTLLVTQGQAPKGETDVGRSPRPLFVFVLDGDRLTRIEAPSLVLDVTPPLLSLLSGGRALLVSRWVEADRKSSAINRSWSIVDPTMRTVRWIGQNRGIAIGDGSGSYVAVSPSRFDQDESNLIRRLLVSK